MKATKKDYSTTNIKVQNPRNLNSLYTEEFSGLAPGNLKYYMECSRKGINFWKSLLFEEIRRRDLRIGGVCQTRKLAVANKRWQIQGSTNENAVGLVTRNFSNLNLTNLFTDIVESAIQGVSTFEIIYDISRAEEVYIHDILYVPNHLLLFDDINNQYRYLDINKADAMKLRNLGWNTLEDRINISEISLENIEALKILEVHSLDGNAQNGFLNGCIDSLIWAFLFKNYGLKDWSVYIERFATPSVIAKYPPLMSKTDKEMLMNAVRNFGHLFKAVIPDTAVIEFGSDQTKSQTSDTFERYIDFWNTEISIRVLGQTGTTNKLDKGSYGAIEALEAVRNDIMRADMMIVEGAMNELIKRLCTLNGLDESPKFKFID